MPFNRPPPVAREASQCSGGVGIDFILELPKEVYRRVLQHLPARQLARISLVNKAWREASEDDSLWAGAFDVSYGSKAAEHLAAISMGDDGRIGSSFTDAELNPEGVGTSHAPQQSSHDQILQPTSDLIA